MTPLARALAAVFVVAALSASSAAPQSVRDGGAAATRHIGTGVVAGLVTLGDDAKTPVRRAVVTLTAADGTETLAAISGDDGRFAIERVAAGRYLLEAAKPAYMTIAYGAQWPGRRGTMLIVMDGEHLNDLTLSLPRGAVLGGRITLPDGRPLANVQMMAVPSRLATGGGTPAPEAREFRTDDAGDFRLFGLMPDTYVVAALPTFGRGEVERLADADISNVLNQLRQPGDAGGRAGSSSPIIYAPTYFPGTPSVGDATRITVSTGQVREGLDFTITAFPAATLRGRVVGLDGAPTQAVALSIEAIGPALPVGALAIPGVGRPDRNGEFQISGVAPGFYRLRARAGGVTLDANGTPKTHPEAQTQFAVADVSVSGQNIDGLTLRPQEGYGFYGTITTDGSAASPALAGASVTVQPFTASGPVDPFAGILFPGVPTRGAQVDDTGHFAVTGLEPFDYQILVELPPPMVRAGWHVDSIRLADRDLRDAPLTFAAGSLEGVSIRLTTTVTELRGHVTTGSGTPAPDYFIVAFPADRSLWHATSPRVRLLRPAADGTFSAQDLPAGTYRLAVLSDVEEHDPQQRAFLESIYAASVEFTLAAGERKVQDLRIR